jgi:hypothetical protein
LIQEEDFWHIKSRNLWLKVGDKYTKKIHNQAKVRLDINNVSKIILEDGTMVTDFGEIKKTTRNHFVELYTQRDEATQANITSMLEHIPTMITNEENIDLN